MRDFEKEQIEICKKYNTEFEQIDCNMKLGVADNFFDGTLPLNGIRHRQENGSSGWYLWAGEEMSEDEDYFKPLHTFHLQSKMPEIIKFLALPEGWRFLVGTDDEDVWLDENLLTN